MTRAIKAGLLALSGATLLIAFAFPVWSQSRARGGAARSGGVSHAAVARVAPRVSRPLSPNYTRFNRVTGRNVNYTRLPAIRVTRGRFGHLHRVAPIVFFGGYSGYYPYDYGYGYDEAPYDTTGQQPVYYALEQPTAAPSESAVAAPEAPVHDVGGLILMRNDGQIVLANAFTISGDRLTYITHEGARRSFPVAELDKDTTRKMNDANGTSVVLP